MSILRTSVFLGSAAFIMLAPGYPQALGGKSKVVPRWEMFSGIGSDVYEVKFEISDGEKRREVDRFEALGYQDPLGAPRTVRLVKSEVEAWALARRLCARGHAPLYMRLRDARRSGWRTIEDGREEVCSQLGPPPRMQ